MEHWHHLWESTSHSYNFPRSNLYWFNRISSIKNSDLLQPKCISPFSSHSYRISSSYPLNPPSNSSTMAAIKVTHSSVQRQADVVTEAPPSPPQETNDQVLMVSTFVPLPQDLIQPKATIENFNLLDSSNLHHSFSREKLHLDLHRCLQFFDKKCFSTFNSCKLASKWREPMACWTMSTKWCINKTTKL